MTDSKLDFPARPRNTGPSNLPAIGANAKLDLPGTLAEFGALEGLDPETTLALRPYRHRESNQAIANAAGDATVSLGAPAIGWSWYLERIVVLGGGTVAVYVGGIQAANEVDLTAFGGGDVADESSPIYVEEGLEVQVVFTGAAPGTICTANAQILYVPGD